MQKNHMAQSRIWRKATGLLLAIGLTAAGCGGGTSSNTIPAGTATSSTAEASDTLPGEGISFTMARANWDDGYFHAALFRQLLQRLGYEVSDPAENELGPNLAYIAMSEGDIDFWANSWYPNHNSWLIHHLSDGSLVGERISRVGGFMSEGLLQGYFITKSFAEEYGISTLDDLSRNPEAVAAYDADDFRPGDGIVDIYGCPESWTCDDIIQSQIAFSGFDNIKQILASYEAMFAEAISKIDAGQPALLHSWSPSPYVVRLRPGEKVMWIGVEEVIDDSNPLERDGGEGWDQRPGQANISADTCLYIVDNGLCQTGFKPADIVVTARNDLLENHPAAKRLFEVATIDPIVVAQMTIRVRNQEAPEDLAAEWINENIDRVEAWIAEALAAA